MTKEKKITDLNNYPYIWCDQCNEIQPLWLHRLVAQVPNDHEAVDLVCFECKFLVATIHEDVNK